MKLVERIILTSFCTFIVAYVFLCVWYILVITVGGLFVSH